MWKAALNPQGTIIYKRRKHGTLGPHDHQSEHW